MQLIDEAICFPGCCYFCKGTDGPFIDTDQESPDGTDRLYICIPCLEEAAVEAGLLTLKQAQELKAQNASLRGKTGVLTKKLKAYKEIEAQVQTLIEVKA